MTIADRPISFLGGTTEHEDEGSQPKESRGLRVESPMGEAPVPTIEDRALGYHQFPAQSLSFPFPNRRESWYVGVWSVYNQ